MSLETEIRKTAEEALDLKMKMEAFVQELEAKKELLRQFAKGDQLEVTIEGKGKVRVSKPREAKEEEVLVVNLPKLDAVPDLKDALLKKGVLKKEMKKSPAAKASVTVDANV